MRRILYLYPKRWRRRYADELDELLDHAPLTVRGAVNIGILAAALRMRDGPTLAFLSALLAAAALVPFVIMTILWLNFVILPRPFDPSLPLAMTNRFPPTPVLPFVGLAAAVLPMLQDRAEPGGGRRIRIRWRSYPIHAGLALVAVAWVSMAAAELYDQVWHGVARWYWALCATSCHEPWMAPLSLGRIIYPWILLPTAGWLVWRWVRR